MRITVRVTPRGGRDAVDGWIEGADGERILRVRVAAPASEGRANAALLRLLAEAAGVPTSSVRILAGGRRSRVKVVEIDSVAELGQMSATTTPPDITSWRPLSVDEVQRAFAPLRAPWWIAGGWAIDLFVGEQTRPHGDIDIAILRGDVLALRDLQDEFDLYVAHAGELTLWDGGALARDRHQFWARRCGDDAWAFEILFEESAERDTWVYRRDARIRRPLAQLGRVAVGGVPFVAPEVALLYKANRREIARSEADFAHAAPLLFDDARTWLREALAIAYPGHAWLEVLL